MMCFLLHDNYIDPSCWTLAGNSWQAAPSPGIISAGSSVLAYDSQRRRVVLAVLTDNGAQVNTSEWDGTSWRQVVTAHVPQLSQWASAAYSPELHAVVVHDEGMGLEPTWLYDGTDWRSVVTAHGPIDAIRMEYDPTRHLIIGVSYRDYRTWLFDGVDWTALQPPSTQSITPALGNMGRQGPAIALDEQRDQWVLFGGYDAINYYSDTWVGDGSSWNKVSPPTAPQARSGNGGSDYLAWDPALRRLVLFGGEASPQRGYLGDTWAWDGTNWSQLSPVP